MDRDVLSVISVIAGFLGGGIVALVTHLFALRRETKNREHAAKSARRSRRLDFLSFMRGWRVDVQRNAPQVVSDRFSEKVILFEGEIARIVEDYDRAEIERMTQGISSTTLSSIRATTNGQDHPGKDELLGRMTALIDYVSAN